MITDEAGLHWRLVDSGQGPRGEEFSEHVCQHERLTRMVQRPSHDAPWVETYHVEGLAQQYKTPHAALQALRQNP